MDVFIAPHLDDAVLSCGGLIHSLARGGTQVMVVTVMAGDPPCPLLETPIVRDLHRRWQAGYNPVAARREEDRKAVASLGGEARHLTVADCVYRSGANGALYPTEEALFGGVHPDDDVLAAMPQLPVTGARRLYLPLGVGRHVDHRIVRDMGRRWWQQMRDATPIFYEEYPYIETPGAVEQALAALPDVELEARLYQPDEAALAAKIRAIGRYQSQISTFWESHAAMARAVRRTMAQTGGGSPAERYWYVR